MTLLTEQLLAELSNLKRRYISELEGIADRALSAVADAKRIGGVYSTHVPFNLSANCQNLAELAAKIEQTQMILRTIDGNGVKS